MRTLNITFHGIGEMPASRPPEEAGVWVSVRRFEQIMDAVTPHGNVRITFDDGNASDARVALPALLARGMKARFYVCAGLLGCEGYLAAGEVRQLAAAGMTVGSHGMYHRPWRGLSGEELHREVGEARDRLEQLLGSAVTEAACPFGAYGRRSLAALREAGFSRVYTSDGGPAVAEHWLQPRNTVHSGDSAEAVGQWISNAQRPVPLLRRLKLQVKRWR